MSDEYPKVIDIDGLKVTVADAVQEAMWLGEFKPPQGDAARTNPLNAIELDGAALNNGHEPESEPEPDEPIKKKPATAGGSKKK